MEERLKKIAQHYGTKSQLRQLTEECCELAVECNHSIRRGLTIGLIEEIADVEIMLEQIKYLCDIHPKDITELKAYKIDRQIKRIEDETKTDK